MGFFKLVKSDVLEVTIAGDGSFSPETWNIDPGDIVEIASPDEHAVVCISNAKIFGSGRYEVPKGKSVTLVMQSFASGPFEVITLMGNLEKPCKGGRGGTGDGSGGGSAGGGG